MKKPPFLNLDSVEATVVHHQRPELLDDIANEPTPERLFDLARQLQEKLVEQKRRDRPN